MRFFHATVDHFKASFPSLGVERSDWNGNIA